MDIYTFQVVPKSFLGIDIGTSAIKIVELSKWGNRVKLENYGEIKAESLYEKPFRTFEKSTLTLSSQDIAKGIRAIFEEAKIKNKKAYFSIPDFSSFFTWFSLPPMTKEEIPQAVKNEARQYIPLPLSEVTLDWQVIEGNVGRKKDTPLKVLLVAVPNEVINQYRGIANLVGLELQALEAEVFGFLRAVAFDKDSSIMLLLDIGARSTTISVAERLSLKRTHSFDMAGNNFTEVISKSLGVDFKEAQNLKNLYGILNTQDGPKIKEILLPLVDLIISEAEKILTDYRNYEKKDIQKIILAGGEALLPGLREYFSEKLGLPTEIADPFSPLFFPPILEDTLKKMGPSYAIAVGIALRGLA